MVACCGTPGYVPLRLYVTHLSRECIATLGRVSFWAYFGIGIAGMIRIILLFRTWVDYRHFRINSVTMKVLRPLWNQSSLRTNNCLAYFNYFYSGIVPQLKTRPYTDLFLIHTSYNPEVQNDWATRQKIPIRWHISSFHPQNTATPINTSRFLFIVGGQWICNCTLLQKHWNLYLHRVDPSAIDNHCYQWGPC